MNGSNVETRRTQRIEGNNNGEMKEFPMQVEAAQKRREFHRFFSSCRSRDGEGGGEARVMMKGRNDFSQDIN